MLIVDDHFVNRKLLRKMFEEQFEILEAENGVQAIDAIKEHESSICIVLLDLVMPIMDGFGVLDFMGKQGIMSRIPVILITADDDVSRTKKSYEFGVTDIIRKPFDKDIILRRIKNVVDLYNSKREIERKLKEQEQEINEKNRELQENNEFLVDALSSVVEFRSIESSTHIKRIKYFTKILLVALMRLYPEYGLTVADIDRIVMASALHDIGKVGISDEILLKPGKLTKDEFEIIKSHATIGGDIIQKFSQNKNSQFYRDCYDICMYHHEKYDGKGYPKGLKGDEIPISAQIVSVADVFDALVSKRVYKTPCAPHYALDMIYNGECGEFSDKMIHCLSESSEEFVAMAEQMEY